MADTPAVASQTGQAARRGPSQAHTVLGLEEVTMQFGGVVAVNKLSLEVHKDEIVALIGPNGAGKTTAFNCITGVYEPTGGRILFNGEVIAGQKKSLTPDLITRMGIARTFQNIRLFKALTVFDNVMIAKHMRAKQNIFTATFRLNAKEEKRMRKETLALLEEQQLVHLKDTMASNLPYGLQRRLEIARALATGPKLLLLDEPAAGMNPQETQELADFIRQTRTRYNLTIFLIEHHMDLVMGISDKIYVMDFGKMIASGNPDEVRNDHRVIDAYLGVAEEDEAVAEEGGGR